MKTVNTLQAISTKRFLLFQKVYLIIICKGPKPMTSSIVGGLIVLSAL